MPPTRRLSVTRVTTEGQASVRALGEDEVAVEEPLELRVEGESLLVTMRTPGHDVELAAGLLYTEGVIDGADDLVAVAHIDDPADARGNTMDTRLAGGVRRGETTLLSSQRAMFASSACGICGGATVDRVLSRVGALSTPRRASAELLLSLPARMREARRASPRPVACTPRRCLTLTACWRCFGRTSGGTTPWTRCSAGGFCGTRCLWTTVCCW